MADSSDVVSVIEAQHRAIDALLEQASAGKGDVKGLLQQVADLLVPHSKAEESFVYPSIEREAPKEGEEVHDSTAEHHHMEGLLNELLAEAADEPGFDGKLAAFVGELRHHVEEEEQELLPALKQNTSTEDLDAMGARFARETDWTGGSASEASGSSGSASDESGSSGSESGSTGEGRSKQELYDEARERGISGRSQMSKEELAKALDEQ